MPWIGAGATGGREGQRVWAWQTAPVSSGAELFPWLGAVCISFLCIFLHILCLSGVCESFSIFSNLQEPHIILGGSLSAVSIVQIFFQVAAGLTSQLYVSPHGAS